MHEVYREFLVNFFGWTILAGLCLGLLYTGYRFLVWGANALRQRILKQIRLKEFKSHFPQRVK